jgi:hypothetical protein
MAPASLGLTVSRVRHINTTDFTKLKSKPLEYPRMTLFPNQVPLKKVTWFTTRIEEAITQGRELKITDFFIFRMEGETYIHFVSYKKHPV